MPKLIINRIEVEVPENATLLEAAQRVCIEIPTMCYAEGKPPNTSCMVCVVEETKRGQLLPACAARAEADMVIETDSEMVRHARRAALELLLSEHLGDCEAPCERACPAGLNIPLMLRYLARGEISRAQEMARQALVLPAVLGRICTAPCEAGCRRGSYDEPVAIRQIHGQLGEMPRSGEQVFPKTSLSSGRSVTVIGAGLRGLAAAQVLSSLGHTCRVYEKRPAAGGSLRELPEDQLPREVLDAEITCLTRMGIEFIFETEAEQAISMGRILEHCDAVVLACDLSTPRQCGLFHAENQRLPVRSVASGKHAARVVHEYLTGLSLPSHAKYQSIMGRLSRGELDAYISKRTSQAALNRSRNAAEMRDEADRCLHCDCHAPVSCKLRRYAAEYGARPKVFRNAERPLPTGLQRYDNVIFDAGKCIKCGLCVAITKEQNEIPGLTFTGRGLAMQVSVPFGEPLANAIALCARECVDACPTGALAFDTVEERTM